MSGGNRIMDKKYIAKIIMSSKDMSYETMWSFATPVRITRDVKAGEVLNDQFIPTDLNPIIGEVNDIPEGYWVRAVPLSCISVCTSPFDLSEYGFEKIGKENSCFKWVNFDRVYVPYIPFYRATQAQEGFKGDE
jgi:hypothetical protein